MEKFITVATFQYPHEAYVLRTKLESQGVRVFLKDELTVQVHNFLSNAIGGVKLQIRESDLKKALPLLADAGFLERNDTQKPAYLNWIDKRTNNMPIIKNWPVELKAFFVAGLIVTSAIVFFFLFSQPSKEERLSRQKQELELKAADQPENYYLPLIDSLIYSEPQRAIDFSKKLLHSAYPNNKELYSRIAYGYVEMDSFKLASQYFNASMAYSFRNPAGLSAMAYCAVQLKNYDEAIEYLKEASSINEDFKVQLAAAYEMKEDWKNAEKYYSQYIAGREKWDIHAKRNIEFQKLKIKRDSIKGIIQ